LLRDTVTKFTIRYCQASLILFFLHGCFWHFHQDCSEGKIPKSNSEFWQEKLVKNVERDKKHEADLVLKGWTVIVVWECEIERHLDKIILELEKQFALNNF
jgi:DNA mismatch endonuclease (patch repair protein)